MDKLNCMKTFCQVVKEGNFSAAARKLNVSKVMVSRSISHLEEELGIRLLQRTTRKMSLTDEGSAYYEKCQSLMDDFDELDMTIKNNAQSIKGKLRIAVPSESFTSLHLLPFFREMSKNYPDIILDINMSDRHIDIVEDGFDVAIRIGELEDSSLIAKKLASIEFILCASKYYADKHIIGEASISQPSDITSHSFIFDSNYRNGQQIFFRRNNQSISVKINGRISVNSAIATCNFISNNMGIGITPDFMMKEHMKSGEIIRLLPEWKLNTGGVYAVYSNRKHLSNKVKCFINEVTQYFEQHYQ